MLAAYTRHLDGLTVGVNNNFVVLTDFSKNGKL